MRRKNIQKDMPGWIDQKPEGKNFKRRNQRSLVTPLSPWERISMRQPERNHDKIQCAFCSMGDRPDCSRGAFIPRLHTEETEEGGQESSAATAARLRRDAIWPFKLGD